MSSYLNIGSGGPEAAIAMAMKIKGAGDDFAETARSLAHRIEQLEQGAPWGDDDPGREFFKNYSGQPEDGSPLPPGTPTLNVALRTNLHDAGASLSDLGDRGVKGLVKYMALEAENAADIDAAGTPT